MITRQPFGKTGHQSTRIIFGAVALAALAEDECSPILDLLFEYGINHIDTAANYGDSEVKLGPWMKHHRDKFFLATKTQLRDYASARDQIRKSLERLQTDHVDLLQLHYLVDENEWQTAMGEDGALRAAVEARDEGLVRHIGVTGHDVAVVHMHARSLTHFDFDSILLPYNYTMMQNPIYAEGFESLLITAQHRGIAVQTIKSLARGAWQGERTSPTWYAPLTDPSHIEKAVHWVLKREGIFLNTVGDAKLLPYVLKAANTFDPAHAPSDADMQALVQEAEMSPLFV